MRRLALLFLAATWLFPAIAFGQALPYYVDPSARDVAPDLSAVPSIRFLTTADFPPFNYRDRTGALVGFNVDLAKAICSTLKIACTIQAWPWDQVGKALADNQGDALIAGLALTPENGAQFDFSDIYLGLPARFVTQLPAARGFDPSKLAGKTVAVRKGTAHEEFVRRYLPQVKIAEYATEADALAAVKAGKADAFFGDGMRASFWLNDNQGCCGFAGQAYFRPDLFGAGMAIAVEPGHEAVRDVINAALVRLKRDGKLDELYLRWFPVAFY
ncbi:MAG: transporter substrate-binding domain-containing protein [Devosia sp.]|jgi:polar amino acid transport system substrate-binding protein